MKEEHEEKELAKERAKARVVLLTERLDMLEQEMKDIEALRREIINKYDLNKEKQ